MKKSVLLAVILILGSQLFAAFTTSGEVRNRAMYWNNISDKDGKENNSIVDTRFMFKMDNSFDERLSAVLYTEIGEVIWGDQTTGGNLETDGKIIKVKQAYMDYHCPVTNIHLQAGLIGWNDHRSLVLNSDFAALRAEKQLGDNNVSLMLAKLQENDVTKDDDQDLFGLGWNWKQQFGCDVLFARQPLIVEPADPTSGVVVDSGEFLTTNLWIMPWVNYKVTDNFTLDMLLAYNSATKDGSTTAEDVVNNGFALAFNAAYKNKLEAYLDVLYSTGRDFAADADTTDTSEFNTVWGCYYDNGLEIWGTGCVNDTYNQFPANGASGYAIDLPNGGTGYTGLTSIAAKFLYPLTNKLTARFAAGWVQATSVPDGWDNGVGTEFDLGLTAALYQQLTGDLMFAYGIPGDFYKDYIGYTDSLENTMKISARLTYAW